jgi:hypothetical protein
MQCETKQRITAAAGNPQAQVEVMRHHLCELCVRLGELQLDALALADALQRQPHLQARA